MFGIVFAQVPGRQGTEIRTGGGVGGGGVTGQYVFNGPFTVQNVTNVFIRDAISNIFTAPITNLADSQFANESTIATIKELALFTNIIIYSNLSIRRLDDSPVAIIGINANNSGILSVNFVNPVGVNSDFITNTSVLTNLGPVYVGGGISVGQGLSNAAGAISSAIYKIPGTATNMFLMLGGNGNIVTGRLDAATMAMSTDGILSSTVVGGAQGTNFSQIRLDGEIYNITNAGNNTTVTADWNGARWMRLQLAGSTTISFTNCPANQPTNGHIFVLELYAPTTVPSVTIQNIDSRAIDWGKVGQPVLVDGETNLLVVRFDGTNFLGRSWQDKTVGTITSPYVLEKNSTTSNHMTYGVFSLTNLPGDGSPELRFKNTNGNGYLSMTIPDFWRPTNKIVWGITNPVAGDSIEILSVSISGGVATIILTNGVDGGGAGSPGGQVNSVQYQSNSAFAGNEYFLYDPTNNLLWLKQNPASPAEIQVSDIAAPNATNEMGGQYIGQLGAHSLGIINNGTNNWLFNPLGHFTPSTPAAHDIGARLSEIRQFYRSQSPLAGHLTATNMDLTNVFALVSPTNITVDMQINISNVVAGLSGKIVLIGQTNAATNHTITLTGAGGATLNYLGVATNGSFAFTVYSNSIAKIEFDVWTNTIATNILIEYSLDSGWPQRNIPLLFAAGGGQSNATVGGLYYYDQMPTAYTNNTHTNFANASFTNLAMVNIAGNTLTNYGDTLIFIWRGQLGTIAGTNQLIGSFGNATNALGDTGAFTNNPGATWEYKAEIECKGPTNHYVYWEFKLSKTNSLCNGFTNGIIRSFTSGIITNSVTNLVSLQAKTTLHKTISNDYFRVFYQSASFR